MVMDFGGIHFNDVDGSVWTDEPRPYSAFKDELSPEDYQDYLDEYRRQHVCCDDEE